MSMSTEPVGGAVAPYPQTKLRITASYPAGDTPAAGLPDTVEIELNDDAVPAGDPERTVFITQLVASLFRALPTDPANYSIQFGQPDGDSVQIGAAVSGARGREGAGAR